MNDKMEDFVREGGCDIYLQLYNKKFPKIVFYAHRVTLVIDIETNTVRTIFSVKNIRKQLTRRSSKYIFQKKSKSISKWVGMEKILDKDTFELAFDAWVNHVTDLLDEADPYWQDRLLIARTEIEDYLQQYPDEVTPEQREAILKADEWLLENADNPAIKKAIQGIPEPPSPKYWWQDVNTLKEEKQRRKEKNSKNL